MSVHSILSTPLAAVMKDVAIAIDFDRQEKNEDAYRKYLECVLRVTTSLLKTLHSNEGHVHMSPDVAKMVRLGQQCMDRVGNIVQNKFVQKQKCVPQNMHLPLGTCPGPPRYGSQSTPVTPTPGKTTPLITTPQITSPDLSGRLGEHRGGDLSVRSLGNTTVTTRKISPLEMASRQNQQLLTAFRRRQALAKNKSASAALSLTLQRKMAENLAIAHAQEGALAKKMQERQARLEEQAAKRFHTPLGLSEEEQQQRYVYRKVLEFEQEQGWMVQLRNNLENNPTDIDAINELITAVLGCSSHPLTEQLTKYQNKLLDQISHLVAHKESQVEEIKVPLSDEVYSNLKPFQRSISVNRNQSESDLKTDQSKVVLQAVDENDSAENVKTDEQSNIDVVTEEIDKCAIDDNEICESDINSESEFKTVETHSSGNESNTDDVGKVTVEIKDDLEKAIDKSEKLTRKLENENIKVKVLSRQSTEEYERYNQENLDDLFESSEEDEDEPDETKEENEELNEIVKESLDENNTKANRESDENMTVDVEDVESKTEENMTVNVETKTEVTDTKLRGKLKKNPSFENLDTKIRQLKNEAYHRLLKGVTEDILTSIEQVQVLFVIAFEQLDNAEGRDQCHLLLEDFFFRPLWKYLLTLFRLANKPKEISLAYMMTKNQRCSPERFDVREELCLQQTTTGSSYYPYHTAVEEITGIIRCTTMLEKLDFLVKASKEVMLCVEKHYTEKGEQVPSIGADDLLPVLCYVVVRSGLPQLVSECNAVEKFIHEGYMFGEEGYCLTSFQTAINYLISEGIQ